MAEKRSLRERFEKNAEEQDLRQREYLEKKRAKRQVLNEMTLAEVVGKYWFYLALLLLISFPLMDMIQRIQAALNPSLGAMPALSRVFLANGGWGMVFSAPVFLAYGIDYLLAKRKGEARRDEKQKRFRVLILLSLGLLWLGLGLIFFLFKL